MFFIPGNCSHQTRLKSACHYTGRAPSYNTLPENAQPKTYEVPYNVRCVETQLVRGLVRYTLCIHMAKTMVDCWDFLPGPARTTH